MIDVLKYLGKKWSPDFNCWDFVSLIYKKEFGIELCKYGINDSRNIKEACKAVETECSNAVWAEVEKPVENDLMLLGKGNLRWHVAFLINQDTAIHLIDNGGVMVQDLLTLKSEFNTFKFFNHAQVPPCIKSDETAFRFQI